jgi:hypothetical protein
VAHAYNRPHDIWLGSFLITSQNVVLAAPSDFLFSHMMWLQSDSVRRSIVKNKSGRLKTLQVVMAKTEKNQQDWCAGLARTTQSHSWDHDDHESHS